MPSQIIKDDRKSILSKYLVVVVALIHSEEVEVIGFGVSEPRVILGRRSKTLQEAGSHVIRGGGGVTRSFCFPNAAKSQSRISCSRDGGKYFMGFVHQRVIKGFVNVLYCTVLYAVHSQNLTAK